MSRLLKPFDDKVNEYRNLVREIRRVKRKGIDERNSFKFFINLDKIQPLADYVNRNYHMKLPKDIESIIEDFC